jgi:hypothetical protein
MTAKQFNKEKEAIYLKYGAKKNDRYEVTIENSFGTMFISAENSPRIKVASIHSKLDGDTQKFKDVTGYDINTYNGKCNFYSSDPEYILDTLDKYLNNLKYYE